MASAVQPANTFLDSQGYVKLGDFGAHGLPALLSHAALPACAACSASRITT